ncbi:hypothetical protein K439DRAFT_808485 [Ramaria rubella]|nr:hypothetical protein K439DRAFT_805956 [Ramaria rubella]KAF8587543.1 hypothetical protein K439DRAFT_808485 [Ramaria rubella]
MDATISRSRWEQFSERALNRPPSPRVKTNIRQPRPILEQPTSNVKFVSCTRHSSAGTPTPNSEVSGSRRPSRQLTSSRQSTRSHSPPGDDTSILRYPPTGTGAVTVTNGDLKRLEPGEFLNDILIELGLKLWLNDLYMQNPELADQVHVFNSFFYTQLKQNKNIEEAYQSVRKWTSKFDLFKKKYIIVPINENLHWYLAIICYPERALQQPTLDHAVLTNPRESISTKSCPENQSQRPSTSKDGTISWKTLVEDEQEVEQAVYLPDESTLQSDIPSKSFSHSPPPSPLTILPDDEPEVIPATDSEDEDNAEHADVIMQSKPCSPKLGPAKFHPSPVPVKEFYAISDPIEPKPCGDDLMDIDMCTPAADVTRLAKPYIFSFDSLGARHPHALKILSQYLNLEAKDKKGWMNTVPANTKMASVRVSPTRVSL